MPPFIPYIVYCLCVYGMSLQDHVHSLQSEVEERERLHRERETAGEDSHRQRERELRDEISALNERVSYDVYYTPSNQDTVARCPD